MQRKVIAGRYQDSIIIIDAKGVKVMGGEPFYISHEGIRDGILFNRDEGKATEKESYQPKKRQKVIQKGKEVVIVGDSQGQLIGIEIGYGIIFQEHIFDQPIVSLAYGKASGNTIAALSADGTMKVFQVALPQSLRLVCQCSSSVSGCFQVEMTPSGSLLASLGEKVEVFDIKRQEKVYEIDVNHDTAQFARFSPNGKQILIGHKNRRFEIFSLMPSLPSTHFIAEASIAQAILLPEKSGKVVTVVRTGQGLECFRSSDQHQKSSKKVHKSKVKLAAADIVSIDTIDSHRISCIVDAKGHLVLTPISIISSESSKLLKEIQLPTEPTTQQSVLVVDEQGPTTVNGAEEMRIQPGRDMTLREGVISSDLTLEKRLLEMNPIVSESSGIHDSLDTLVHIIENILKGKDTHGLHTLLAENIEAVKLVKTIKKLKHEHVVPFLELLVDRLVSVPSGHLNIMRWVEALISHHYGTILSYPNVSSLLVRVFNHLNQRMLLFEDFLQLDAKLGVVLDKLSHNFQHSATNELSHAFAIEENVDFNFE